MRHRDRRQPLVGSLPYSLVLALEDAPRRRSAQVLMRLSTSGQQVDIGRRIACGNVSVIGTGLEALPLA